MLFDLFLFVSVFASCVVKSRALDCYQAKVTYRVAWPQYDNDILKCRSRCSNSVPLMSSLLYFNNDVCWGADGWDNYATSQFGYYVKGTQGCNHLICECEVSRIRWRVHKDSVNGAPCDKDTIAARIESTAGPELNAFPYKAIWIFTTNEDVHCGSQRSLQEGLALSDGITTDNITMSELSLPALSASAAQGCVHGLN